MPTCSSAIVGDGGDSESRLAELTLITSTAVDLACPRCGREMKNLAAKAWLALAGLAWVYVSIFTGILNEAHELICQPARIREHREVVTWKRNQLG